MVKTLGLILRRLIGAKREGGNPDIQARAEKPQAVPLHPRMIGPFSGKIRFKPPG